MAEVYVMSMNLRQSTICLLNAKLPALLDIEIRSPFEKETYMYPFLSLIRVESRVGVDEYISHF